MWREGAIVLLAIGSALAACSGGDGTPAGPTTTQRPAPAIPAPGPSVPPTPVKIVLEQPDASVDGGAPASPEAAPAIAVEQGARLSLALGGTLAPSAEDQTVTRAMVTIGEMALVRADGRPVTAYGGSFTADLLSLQCAVRTIVDGAPVRAGRFPELRFRLVGAWIETLDASKVAHVFASSGEDPRQFGATESVRPLRIEGVDGGGFVTAGLPRGGLAVQGTTSLALHFALDESLSPQGRDSWVLRPVVRLVDESSFSSLAVSYRFASQSDGAYLSKGFQSILLDANLLPVCRSGLQKASPTEFVASFRYLEPSQGPFVVSLLPPEGTSLQPPVAVSIDVQQSASASAVIDVTSMRQPSSSSFEIATTGKGAVEQRVRRGQVIERATVPVGDVAEVAPRGHGATYGL